MIQKIITVVTSLLILSAAQGAFAQTKEVNGIAAVVNNQVITTYELEKQVSFFTQQLRAAGTQLPPASIIRKQVLQQMIDIRVQTWAAEQSSIKVTNAEINKAVADVAKQETLTTKELYKKMGSYDLSIDEYRAQLKDQLTIHRLVQRDLVPTLVVSDEQIKQFQQSRENQAYMNMEYDLEDILLEIPDAATSAQVQAVKKKAEALLEDILSGETTFKKAAVESSDAKNAFQGGELGWRQYSELPSAFAKAVVSMKADEVAGPFRAPNGYHLLKLVAVKRDDGATPLTDEQIRQALFTKKLMVAQQTWLAKLKAQSYIKIYGASSVEK
jgi:peptidyl-prolyl cis-trans isomerase SurA